MKTFKLFAAAPVIALFGLANAASAASQPIGTSSTLDGDSSGLGYYTFSQSDLGVGKNKAFSGDVFTFTVAQNGEKLSVSEAGLLSSVKNLSVQLVQDNNGVLSAPLAAGTWTNTGQSSTLTYSGLRTGVTYALVFAGTANKANVGYTATTHLTAVPIPAAVVLFGAGLVGLGAAGRSRAKKLQA
ncbi:MAG: hypothetical protein JO142_13395 [Burkholderiales bacterium]|nr:hypothetical protein [Burkholderiales bacterium]